MTDSLLAGTSRIFQYLKPEAVRALFEQHTSGRRDNHKILFSLVVLEEWLRTCDAPLAVTKAAFHSPVGLA